MLESAGAEPERERSTRLDPLTEAEAKKLLSIVAKVVVCRGRKRLEMEPDKADTGDLKGPTGNFRAPMLHVDDTLVVGFHRETLAEIFG